MITNESINRLESFDKTQRIEERRTLSRRIARLEIELGNARVQLRMLDQIEMMKNANRGERVNDVVRRFNQSLSLARRISPPAYLKQLAIENDVEFDEVAFALGESS